jgi:hypothetical protein
MCGPALPKSHDASGLEVVARVGLTPAALTILYRWPLESSQLDEFGNHDKKLAEPPHKVARGPNRGKPALPARTTEVRILRLRHRAAFFCAGRHRFACRAHCPKLSDSQCLRFFLRLSG